MDIPFFSLHQALLDIRTMIYDLCFGSCKIFIYILMMQSVKYFEYFKFISPFLVTLQNGKKIMHILVTILYVKLKNNYRISCFDAIRCVVALYQTLNFSWKKKEILFYFTFEND